MEPNSQGGKVFYERPKAYWRSGSNVVVDILLVEHREISVIEVIIRNHITNSEAPRIYLSSHIVTSKLSSVEINDRINIEKEPLIRRRKDIDIEALTQKVTYQMLSEYIVARLDLPKSYFTSGEFVMELIPLAADKINENTGKLDIISSKPRDLMMYVTPKSEIITMTDFDSKITEFQTEKDEISNQCKKAHTLSKLANKDLQQFKVTGTSKDKFDRAIRTLSILRQFKKNSNSSSSSDGHGHGHGAISLDDVEYSIMNNDRSFDLSTSTKSRSYDLEQLQSPRPEQRGLINNNNKNSFEKSTSSSTRYFDFSSSSSTGSGKLRSLDDSLVFENTNSDKVRRVVNRKNAETINYNDNNNTNNSSSKATTVGTSADKFTKMPNIYKSASNTTGIASASAGLLSSTSDSPGGSGGGGGANSKPLFRKTIDTTHTPSGVIAIPVRDNSFGLQSPRPTAGSNGSGSVSGSGGHATAMSSRRQQMVRKKSIQDLLNGENINHLPILNMKQQISLKNTQLTGVGSKSKSPNNSNKNTNKQRRNSVDSNSSKNVALSGDEFDDDDDIENLSQSSFSDSDYSGSEAESECEVYNTNGPDSAAGGGGGDREKRRNSRNNNNANDDSMYTTVAYGSNSANSSCQQQQTQSHSQLQLQPQQSPSSRRGMMSKMFTKEHTNHISGLKIVTTRLGSFLGRGDNSPAAAGGGGGGNEGPLSGGMTMSPLSALTPISPLTPAATSSPYGGSTNGNGTIYRNRTISSDSCASQSTTTTGSVVFGYEQTNSGNNLRSNLARANAERSGSNSNCNSRRNSSAVAQLAPLGSSSPSATIAGGNMRHSALKFNNIMNNNNNTRTVLTAGSSTDSYDVVEEINSQYVIAPSYAEIEAPRYAQKTLSNLLATSAVKTPHALNLTPNSRSNSRSGSITSPRNPVAADRDQSPGVKASPNHHAHHLLSLQSPRPLGSPSASPYFPSGHQHQYHHYSESGHLSKTNSGTHASGSTTTNNSRNSTPSGSSTLRKRFSGTVSGTAAAVLSAVQRQSTPPPAAQVSPLPLSLQNLSITSPQSPFPREIGKLPLPDLNQSSSSSGFIGSPLQGGTRSLLSTPVLGGGGGGSGAGGRKRIDPMHLSPLSGLNS